MRIMRFSLGVRFDTLKEDVTPSDIDTVLKELTSLFCVKEVEKLHIFGGVCKLNDSDGSGIYTVVFMNGGLKKMRHVYSKINLDARLHSMLDAREPFLQNNVIRNFENMEFFGAVGADGVCAQGDGRSLRFPARADKRKLFSKENTVILAPNAFKGTIPAQTAARHLRRVFRESLPNVTCVPIPVADGGDGSLNALENAVIGQRHGMEVTDPYGKRIRAEYYVVDGSKAFIESALASGLALCDRDSLNPLQASSIGVGELMLRAAHEGIREIYVCLGGSATNDCGIGMASALGVRFLDSDGNEVHTAENMSCIASIDASQMDAQIRASRIIAMCDVKNPLTGEYGATYTFGSQKGASPEILEVLERGMLNMEKLLNAYAGKDVCTDGAGAAGGMGAMLIALLNAEMKSGAEAILEIAEFDNKIKEASLVITGEGGLDKTSLSGKAVGAVIEHAKRAGVPVAVIAGHRGDGADAVERMVKYHEYSESESDALKFFDMAARRLVKKTMDMFE